MLPCFTKLFEKPCEKIILDLIFMLATWHTLAKLHMHVTSTLKLFHGVMKALGQLLRHFNDHVCSKYDTVETPAKCARKAHQMAAKVAKANDLDSTPKTDGIDRKSVV